MSRYDASSGVGAHVRRREFITGFGSIAAVWSGTVRAQQLNLPVVGFLHSASLHSSEARLAGFRDGLRQAGYVENQNVAVEYRWAEERHDRLPALAADLVRRQVKVIAAAPSGPAVAAKAATTNIPVVFYTAGDPVELGLVSSLSRPGGNLTGITSLQREVGPKRLELLRELAPNASDVALLINSTTPLRDAVTKDMQDATRAFGMRLHVLHARNEAEAEAAFVASEKLRIGALVIAPDTLFTSIIARLGALSLRHSVPTIYQYREFVAAGGLISYGGDVAGWYRQIGVYTGRVLNGEKVADLPVVQATKFDLTINLKTARALGLTVPLPLLGRADEVIE
jgi:putative ABC transport system substrate-binding protein